MVNICYISCSYVNLLFILPCSSFFILLKLFLFRTQLHRNLDSEYLIKIVNSDFLLILLRGMSNMRYIHNYLYPLLVHSLANLLRQRLSVCILLCWLVKMTVPLYQHCIIDFFTCYCFFFLIHTYGTHHQSQSAFYVNLYRAVIGPSG